MQSMLYLAFSFGPAITLALYFYLKKHKSQSFMHMIILSFVMGMASTVALLIASSISDKLGISEPKNLKRTLFFAFITVAAASELAKFIVYRYIILRKNIEVTPSDAIILSISTAMGYSTVALLFCKAGIHPISRYLPQVLFSLTYIPANLLFAVVVGFFVGMARFLHNHIVYSLTGLIVAIFFHGMLIFCLITRDFKLLSLFAFGSAMIVTFLAMKAVNTVPEASK